MNKLLGCLLLISAGAAVANEEAEEAKRLNSLAVSYSAQRKYAEAEPLIRRALAIWEKTNPNSVDFAIGLNNLAQIMRFTKRAKQAEPLFKRSLAIMEKQLPATDPRIASILNNLADFSRQHGREAAAGDYYLRSLAILQKAYGAKDPRVKAVLQALAAMSYKPPRVEVTIDAAYAREPVRPSGAALSVR